MFVLFYRLCKKNYLRRCTSCPQLSFTKSQTKLDTWVSLDFSPIVRLGVLRLPSLHFRIPLVAKTPLGRGGHLHKFWYRLHYLLSIWGDVFGRWLNCEELESHGGDGGADQGGQAWPPYPLNLNEMFLQFAIRVLVEKSPSLEAKQQNIVTNLT